MHSLNHNGKALLGRESKKAVHFVADFTQVMMMMMINANVENHRPRTNSLSPERLRRATPSPSFPSRYFDHDGDDNDDKDLSYNQHSTPPQAKLKEVFEQRKLFKQ